MIRLRVFLYILALTAPLVAQAAEAAAPLPSLALRVSDLRPGYHVVVARSRSRANLTSQNGVSGPVMLSHGWLAGYDTVYRRPENAAIQVGQEADKFRNAQGAHWWYGVSLVRVPAGYRTLLLPQVGDESKAVQSRSFVGIFFRRGAYSLTIYVSMLAPSAQGAVLTLARHVDLRLQQAQLSTPATATLQPQRGQFLLRAWVSPNPMRYNIYPRLYARTVPGALCTASVVYVNGYMPHSFHGYALRVGPGGIVSWNWHELMPRSSGTGTVICTLHNRTLSRTVGFRIAG